MSIAGNALNKKHGGNCVINQKILQNKRADYGKKIVVTLSRQLTEKCGRNFEEKNLRRMVQFAVQFDNYKICRYTVTTIELVAYFDTTTA